MKRNHLVILALLFALLPVLSACDSNEPSDPEIAGTWAARDDNFRLTLDLQGNSNVTGWITETETASGIATRSRVSGTYDYPDVTLFIFDLVEGEEIRVTGFVNSEGTSLTLIILDGERITFTRR